MKYKYIISLFCICLLCNLSIIPGKYVKAGNICLKGKANIIKEQYLPFYLCGKQQPQFNMPVNSINNNAIIPAMKTKNVSQAGYKIKEDKKEFKDKKGNIRGIVSFQYPQFTSTSPAAIKINRQLKNKSRQYFKSGNFKNIKKYTKDAIKHNRFQDKTDQYLWTTFCSIAYNKDNIVSFQMAEWWYAGGVTTQDYYGLNYNLDTGKELEIKDIIKGNAKAKILKAAKKYLKGDKAAYKIIKDTKKYKFYFEEGTVYICYGGYGLNRGPGYDIFTVKIPDINI